jgi:hypothetical protein
MSILSRSSKKRATDAKRYFQEISREARTPRNDFCDAYGVCRATAYKMMKNGTLRTVLIGGRRVIPVDAAEALLREGA